MGLNAPRRPLVTARAQQENALAVQLPGPGLPFPAPTVASPPLIHPARGPPQTELDMGPVGGNHDEVAHESFPDDLDQTPEFDPTQPEPAPADDFDRHSEG